VVRITGELGARGFATVRVLVAPARQRLDVRRARVRKPNGDLIAAQEALTGLLSDPALRLFYDESYHLLDFSEAHLAPGDILEIDYTLTDQSTAGMGGIPRGALILPQEPYPIRRFEFILHYPADRPIRWGIFPPDALGDRARLEQSTADDMLEVRWTAHAIPALPLEPDMPPLLPGQPKIIVSPFESWDRLARWYRRLIRTQLAPDQAIRRKTAELLDGARDRRERIARIFRFVTEETRYVGLEFGVHGYKPYRAGECFTRRFGDCKDKATLLLAMLDVAGVRAWPVLLRTRSAGEIPAEIPSLDIFNHMIAYLPDDDLWLDGTVSSGRIAELPVEDQGCLALVLPLEDEPQPPSRTPRRPASSNLHEISFTGRLGARGLLQGKVRIVGRGMFAATMRELRSRQAADDMVRALVRDTLPNSEVTRASWDPGPLVESHTTAAATLGARLHRDADGALRLPLFLQEFGFGERFAPLAERKTPLDAGPPMTLRLEARLRIARRLHPLSIPEATAVETPFGSARLTLTTRRNRVEAALEVVLRGGVVSPEDYPAFREFCLRVDALRRERLVLR
jgi:hypothetical protein